MISSENNEMNLWKRWPFLVFIHYLSHVSVDNEELLLSIEKVRPKG